MIRRKPLIHPPSLTDEEREAGYRTPGQRLDAIEDAMTRLTWAVAGMLAYHLATDPTFAAMLKDLRSLLAMPMIR